MIIHQLISAVIRQIWLNSAWRFVSMLRKEMTKQRQSSALLDPYVYSPSKHPKLFIIKKKINTTVRSTKITFNIQNNSFSFKQKYDEGNWMRNDHNFSAHLFEILYPNIINKIFLSIISWYIFDYLRAWLFQSTSSSVCLSFWSPLFPTRARNSPSDF